MCSNPFFPIQPRMSIGEHFQWYHPTFPYIKIPRVTTPKKNMPHGNLKFVRRGPVFDFDVYNEHPAFIDPLDLLEVLLSLYGKDGFMFGLRLNVYIIYVKPPAVSGGLPTPGPCRRPPEAILACDSFAGRSHSTADRHDWWRQRTQQEDIFKVASRALDKAWKVAIRIDVNQKNTPYIILGAQLLAIYQNIESRERNQDERLRQSLPMLLRVLDAYIFTAGYRTDKCKDPEETDRDRLLALDAESIQRLSEEVEEFTRLAGIAEKRETTDDQKHLPAISPKDDANEVKLVHKALSSCSACTCRSNTSAGSRDCHLTKLMLSVPNCGGKYSLHWDFLYSTKPAFDCQKLVNWQDLSLKTPTSSSGVQVGHIDKLASRASGSIVHGYTSIESSGDLCRILEVDKGSRIRLRLHNECLQHLIGSPEPLAQRVDQSPGLSLATILRTHTLTDDIKGVLAYTLAHWTWRFYDSDWLNTPCTSNSIHFMRDQPDMEDTQKDLDMYPTRPYFAVDFAVESSAMTELFEDQDLLHRDPRARALGIMLVEIGIGSVLPRTDENDGTMNAVKRENKDWDTALKIATRKRPKPEFHYPRYWTAVARCLSLEEFGSRPYFPNDSGRTRKHKLKKRKALLYDQVVYPLEQLLIATGWNGEIDSMGPFRKQDYPKHEHLSPELNTTPDKVSNESKEAEKWLRQVDRLNAEILKANRSFSTPKRPRIAILDTGYDPKFLFSLGCIPRLKGWKDCVNHETQPVDSHGHGTHVLGLVMRIASEADIYVARVAKTSKDLSHVGRIAEAIDWARECEVDLISISFGYTDDHPLISDAISTATTRRHQKLVFFAAAANSGANQEEMFPARHPFVISMRATSSIGTPANFNPSLTDGARYAFATLGIDVPSEPPDARDKPTIRSGSSIATAVSVGIAGMLLSYVDRQSARDSYDRVREAIHTQRGMVAILEEFATTPSNCPDIHYINPRKLRRIVSDTGWALFVARLLGSA
ncbi:hypothetical protein PG984_008444 [Apiospora sp. TS-2023a]